MFRRSIQPAAIAIMILGLIGLGYMIYKEPLKLMMNIIAFAVVILIVMWIIRRVIAKKGGTKNKEYSAYQKAVKQSKQLHEGQTKPSIVRESLFSGNPKLQESKRKSAKHTKQRKNIPFTVIEGKKGKKNKKKNRAHS